MVDRTLVGFCLFPSLCLFFSVSLSPCLFHSVCVSFSVSLPVRLSVSLCSCHIGFEALLPQCLTFLLFYVFRCTFLDTVVAVFDGVLAVSVSVSVSVSLSLSLSR